jgi:hypothetical protein
MGADVFVMVGAVLSAIAMVAAIAALVRIGGIAAQLRHAAEKTAALANRSDRLHPELLARMDELDLKHENISLQLERLKKQISELLVDEQSRIAQTARPAPTITAEPPLRALPADRLPSESPLDGAAVTLSERGLRDKPVPADCPSPMVPLVSSSDNIEGLVAGYREMIAGRSKAPIREWLTKHGSITLDISDDGILIPSDSGLIAAVPIEGHKAILLPTASFVVDFATRFAGSKISMRQVMRNCFDAVADNSGDMKLQTPGIARREGDRWVLEQPGQLSGFTDAE